MKKFSRLIAVAMFAAVSLSSAFASDLTITPANVAMSPAGKSLTRAAGTAMTIAAGKAVYLASDNKFYLCDGDASAAASKFYGIALNAATAGQPVKVCYSDPGFTLGVTLSKGDTIWTSTTAGGLTKTAADVAVGSQYVTVVGIATSTTKINLAPIRSDVITTPTPTPTP